MNNSNKMFPRKGIYQGYKTYRPRAFWGTLISTGASLLGSYFNKKAQDAQLAKQEREELHNRIIEENNAKQQIIDAAQDIEDNYNDRLEFMFGGRKNHVNLRKQAKYGSRHRFC